MRKPVLFLDLDRTLFDTDQLYEFWGITPEKREPYIEKTVAREIPEPDWRQFVFPDVWMFLSRAKEKFTLVLMTRASNEEFQKMKFVYSGLSTYFDDAIYTTGMHAKGHLIKTYLREQQLGDASHVFVDDDPMNISEVKYACPFVHSILILREVSTLRQNHPGYLKPDAVCADFAEVAANIKFPLD